MLNGVVLKMTTKQASTLRSTPGVAMVEKNRIFTIKTSSGNKPDAAPGPSALPGLSSLPSSGPQPPTPQFLGLTGTKGVWQQQFRRDKNAGEGVIIGDIDTGFWPENPSFAAFPEPRSDDAGSSTRSSTAPVTRHGEDSRSPATTR